MPTKHKTLNSRDAVVDFRSTAPPSLVVRRPVGVHATADRVQRPSLTSREIALHGIGGLVWVFSADQGEGSPGKVLKCAEVL